MKYTKPEVLRLGTVVRVIQQIPTQKTGTLFENGVLHKHNPAYDLDE